MKKTDKSHASVKKVAARKKPTTTSAPAERGLVIVITGNGKGKTTSAFGQALRAVGQGYRVYIMQFMKGRNYGEYTAGSRYLPSLTIRRSGLDSFVMRGSPADRAGIQPGDVLLAVDGRKVTDPQSMLEAIAALRPGRKADFELRRGKDTMGLKVEIARRPALSRGD